MSIIIGIKLEQRNEHSKSFQKILTKYGCDISTRIGFHDSDNNSCANFGLILLNFIGSEENLINLSKELIKINNLKLKIMRI